MKFSGGTRNQLERDFGDLDTDHRNPVFALTLAEIHELIYHQVLL